MKYLELCVELKKSYVAKEGIYQYKIICQQTYIKSFEDVVRKYLQMAEEKANQAKEEAQQSQAILDVDDLDNVQTPEDILLSAVSSEDTQDRTDRVVLIPWVKFLWESYRQCLDLLKNNSRTERLYHDVAHQAFKFCIKYNRKTEFRKLCDNLHLHLDMLKKQQQQVQQPHQQNITVNLNNPDSLTWHLETRLVQLDSAIQMELWQEAYKATDDIKRFGLMNLAKKPPKPQMMANYYQKLALVFLKANCPLFHAAALFRLFHLSKELRKNITSEDIQKMASKVVAATLAIPIPPNRAEIDKLVDTEENIIESHQRNLASLLGLSTNVPTRNSLINDLKRMGVLQHAFQPFQDLYKWLEVDFHPLVLCSRVQQVIDFILQEKTKKECPDLEHYVSSLKDVTIMRLLKEVSQVYQTIEYKRLLELCPFANFTYLEKMVVEAARRNDLQVRIDHRKGCLIFGTELRVSQGEELIEGPHLQSMPSEQIRRQLVNMYSTLQKAKNLIEPEKIKAQRALAKRKIMSTYRIHEDEEHKRILSRQEVIEERKEQLEQRGQEREEFERRQHEEKMRKQREAEEERMRKEAEEREKIRKAKKDLELKKQMALDQISMIKGTIGSNLLENLDDEQLANLKPEEIQMKKIEQLEKERREQLTKQRKLERRVDHLERAKRIEEIPLLKKSYEEWKVKDKQLWEIMETERIKETKEEIKLSLQHKQRFKRMLEDKLMFEKKIKDARHAIFKEKLEEFQKILNSEKAKRLEERKLKRKEERRMKWIIEVEEEKKRKQFEEEKKRREEHNAALEKQLEKQRQKEKEIEEKLRQKEAEQEKQREEERLKRERIEEKVTRDVQDDFREKNRNISSRPGIEESWRKTPPQVGQIEKPAEAQKLWRPRVRAEEDKRDTSARGEMSKRNEVDDAKDGFPRRNYDRNDERKDNYIPRRIDADDGKDGYPSRKNDNEEREGYSRPDYQRRNFDDRRDDRRDDRNLRRDDREPRRPFDEPRRPFDETRRPFDETRRDDRRDGFMSRDAARRPPPQSRADDEQNWRSEKAKTDDRKENPRDKDDWRSSKDRDRNSDRNRVAPKKPLNRDKQPEGDDGWTTVRNRR